MALVFADTSLHFMAFSNSFIGALLSLSLLLIPWLPAKFALNQKEMSPAEHRSVRGRHHRVQKAGSTENSAILTFVFRGTEISEMPEILPLAGQHFSLNVFLLLQILASIHGGPYVAL